MEPKWGGSVRPWATCKPSALNSEVEKSIPCLITADRAVRTTVKAMVSAMLIRAFLITSLVTGSVTCCIWVSLSRVRGMN